MDSFELIITPFAVLTPFFVIGIIYYRAWIKKQLDNIDQPQLGKVFTFPGPEAFYNTFIREPKVSQSTKAFSLYKRYKWASKVIKYGLLFSLLVNIIRSSLISWLHH